MITSVSKNSSAGTRKLDIEMVIMSEMVILVDEKDNVLGYQEKLEAHQEGNLHRAISIFVFNSRNELLIQQRAGHKYHSGLKWANTTCSHPRKEETLDESVQRRLKEEMGFTTDLTKQFEFIYKAQVGELIEHEYDHVFMGRYEGEVKTNPKEVGKYEWMLIADIVKDIAGNPEKYGEWFKIIMKDHLDKIKTMVSR